MTSADWILYVVRARGGTLYAGITTDVGRRFAEHESGRGAKALRGRGPLELVARAQVGDRSAALRVELRFKRLPKARKEELVAAPPELEAWVGGARE